MTTSSSSGSAPVTTDPVAAEAPGPFVVLSAERRVNYYLRITPIHCPTQAGALEVAANMAAGDGGEFLVLRVLGSMQSRAHWEPAPEQDGAVGVPVPDARRVYP